MANYIRALLFFIFSIWLMYSSFHVDEDANKMHIGAKVWSDFASHIPLIRSFSLGENWPPQYPLYSGPPIRYHFFYYWFVGKLEKIGLSIEWALNLPSAIGYALILFAIYGLVKHYTASVAASVLSVAFFILDGTLGWIQYFNKAGWSWGAFVGILKNNQFVAMGPWDGGEVLAFWHLNTFTNQRHFAFALGIALIALLFFEKAENFKPPIKFSIAAFFGFLLGVMPQLHKPVLVVMAVCFLYVFVFHKPSRWPLAVTGVVGLITFAWVYSLNLNYQVRPGEATVTWFPGFAIHDNLTIYNFFKFWTWNFGLHFLLFFGGVFLIPKKMRWALLPSLALFCAGFLFKYTNDIMANHKFFNFIQIFICMVTAVSIVKIWELTKNHIKVRVAYALFLAPILVVLTLSGVINLIAQINENKYEYPDVGSDPVATWIHENTNPKDVFLNQRYLYDPASIAGRTIFLGWAYFVGSGEGHDWDARRLLMQSMFTPKDKHILCHFLTNNNLAYVELGTNSSDPLAMKFDHKFFSDRYKPAYVSPDQATIIYKTQDMCLNGSS